MKKEVAQAKAIHVHIPRGNSPHLYRGAQPATRPVIVSFTCLIYICIIMIIMQADKEMGVVTKKEKPPEENDGTV